MKSPLEKCPEKVAQNKNQQSKDESNMLKKKKSMPIKESLRYKDVIK